MKINKFFIISMLILTLACTTFGENFGLTVNASEASPSTSPSSTPGPQGSADPNILKSEATNSSFEINKNEKLENALEVTISGDEEDLSYVVTVQPTHGKVEIADSKSPNFVYTPDEDYVGEDSFSFRLESGEKYSNVAVVSITIKEEKGNIIPFNYIDMQTHWANYSASHLAARGLVIGEQIGNRYYFKPETKMTRGDFMLFLLAITENNLDAEVNISGDIFADKDATPSYLLEAAKVAYSKGIIKGSNNNGKIYLNLARPITRAEAVIMISNIINDDSSVEKITYKDVAQIPSWALNAVKNLTAYQIIQGDAEGTFRPMDILSKGEAAELSYKLLKQLEASGLAGREELK